MGKHLGLSIPHSPPKKNRVGKVQPKKTFFSQIPNLSNSLKKGVMLEAETSEYIDQELKINIIYRLIIIIQEIEKDWQYKTKMGSGGNIGMKIE